MEATKETGMSTVNTIKEIGAKATNFIRINSTRTFQTEFVFQNLLNIICWITGSRSEGVHLTESDADFIVCAPDIEAGESNTESVKVKITDETTKPGFAKLQIPTQDLEKVVQISNALNGNIKDLCHENNGSFYLSTSKVLEAWSIHAAYILPWTGGSLIKQEDNGPAKQVTIAMGNEIKDLDALYAIPCTSLPQSIANFFQRNRHWPSCQFVSKLKTMQVFLVPVGHPESDNQKRFMEWRFSFNLQERALMQHLTGAQVVCFYLLKILQNQIKRKFGSIIKSYYIKTIFLWMMESTQEQDWCDEKVIFHATECLRRIHQCMKQKKCRHYFIPEQNIFEGKKIKTENNSALEKYLASLCDAQDDIWQLLLNQVSGILKKNYVHKQAMIDSMCTCRHLLLSSIPIKDPETALKELEYKKKVVVEMNPEGNAYDSDWVNHMQLSIQSHTGTLKAILDHTLARDSRRNSEELLMNGNKFDSCSGKLKTATVQYFKGNINEALIESGKVIKRNGENIMYFTGFTYIKDKLFDDAANKEKDWESLLSGNICFDVIFLPSEMSMCLPGIQLQLSEGRMVPVNPLVYAYYLQFCIISSDRSKHQETRQLLIEFFKIVNEKEKTGMSYIDWELLGFCYLKTGNHNKAFECLVEARKKRDIGQAIYWHLALLLYDLLNTDS